MWCSTMRVIRSIAVTLSRAGSRRLPGGWKWTSLGAGMRIRPGALRQAAGGTPYARVKARVNASCEP